MRFRFSLSLNSLFIYLFICITNFEPTVLSIYPYICVLQILYVNMAKMTLHFVIVIIGLLFNHTCTFTGSEKDNVLRGRTYLVDVGQRTWDCGFKS
ncbi:hypothetical protein ES288_D11G282900v1 [Gossypium darwinii]|uniref:Uncharacterized protein n=2 Tax=Gossypium TaxID=3633 RepID=A0A5D2ISW4_GOSTO|nr:hypothetical protein ES288_D11G282900v1 [Gossypium darwinii]TYH45727.1 hypothetical protein ES332_D11G285500v1 [Gossypium tomentosum]